MALATAVTLVLGFGLALTLDRSDTRVRTRRSAEEHFGLPVIAEVVKFPFWSRMAASWWSSASPTPPLPSRTGRCAAR